MPSEVEMFRPADIAERLGVTASRVYQLIAAGLPFCSLQATTQHLQPMHLPMST